MKFVDWYFFPRFEAMSEEEYDAYQKKKLVGRYNKVIRSISDYQIKKERAVKLKSMRAYLYGKFIVRIPRVSLDQYPDTPLPAALPICSSGKPRILSLYQNESSVRI